MYHIHLSSFLTIIKQKMSLTETFIQDYSERLRLKLVTKSALSTFFLPYLEIPTLTPEMQKQMKD